MLNSTGLTESKPCRLSCGRLMRLAPWYRGVTCSTSCSRSASCTLTWRPTPGKHFSSHVVCTQSGFKLGFRVSCLVLSRHDPEYLVSMLLQLMQMPGAYVMSQSHILAQTTAMQGLHSRVRMVCSCKHTVKCKHDASNWIVKVAAMFGAGCRA